MLAGRYPIFIINRAATTIITAIFSGTGHIGLAPTPVIVVPAVFILLAIFFVIIT
jgi:hypothetical protein